MSQTGVVAWSQTASSNATADSTVNWAEGMAPSAVNDSARAEMAAVAKYRDDTAGSLTTSGTSTAYTLSTNQVFSALSVLDGQELSVTFHATNGTSPTLNVDSLGAKAINVDTTTAVGTGIIKANSTWALVYDNSNTCFVLKNVPAAIQDSTVATASIAASAVTYAKIQNITNNRLLGNVSGSAAAPEEITIGSGLLVTGTTLTAPAYPPSALYKNLSIKVASNTTVTVTADYVVTTDGTTFQTTAVSSTVNMATTGADALDTGSITTNKWYAIWVIAKSDGTTNCLASQSGSSPTMPSGYTFKARVGWVRTASSVSQLYGTWQIGNRAQYVLGLAQTTVVRSIANGASAGDISVPTWVAASVSGHVPTTASAIQIYGQGLAGGTTGMVAPNNSYDAYNSTTAPPPIIFSGTGTSYSTASMVLESTNVYYAANNTYKICVLGWEDSI